MKFLITILAGLAVISARSQQLVERQWTANLPINISDVARGSNGNIYCAASIYDNSADTSAALALKFNSDFELVWAKQLKTLSGDDMGAVRVLPDGNVFFGAGLGSSISNLVGGCLYKLDSVGNVLWSHLYPGSSDDRITQIFKISNGELLLGVRRGVSGEPMYFLHTNATGDIIDQFTLTYDGQYIRPISINYDGLRFYCAASVFNQQQQHANLLLFSFDLNQVLWAKLIDPGQPVSSAKLLPNLEDGFTVYGEIQDTSSVFNGTQIWVFTTDDTGNPIWSKKYSSNSAFSERTSGIIFLPGGDFLLSQIQEGEVVLTSVISRFNSQGNLIWAKQNLGPASSYFTLRSPNTAIMVGGVADDLALGTSTVNGETACGTADTDLQVDTLELTTQNVVVQFDTSNLSENTADYSVYDANLNSNLVCSSTVGLKENTAAAFHIYPNPTSDRLYIISNLPVSEVKLFDVSGREVLEKTIRSKEGMIHLGGLTSGIYMVSINGKFESRVVVE